jgi:hypothetical protein
MRKIIEKMKVSWKNIKECDKIIKRGEIEDNLSKRCKGNGDVGDVRKKRKY